MNLTTLNPAQLSLLEMFSSVDSESEAEDLNRLIRDYYAAKLEKELDKIWNDGTLNQDKLDELREVHLRTPYKDKSNELRA